MPEFACRRELVLSYTSWIDIELSPNSSCMLDAIVRMAGLVGSKPDDPLNTRLHMKVNSPCPTTESGAAGGIGDSMVRGADDTGAGIRAEVGGRGATIGSNGAGGERLVIDGGGRVGHGMSNGSGASVLGNGEGEAAWEGHAIGGDGNGEDEGCGGGR